MAAPSLPEFISPQDFAEIPALEEAFALSGGAGRYRANVEPFWTHGANVAFGGYIGAVCAFAASRETQFETLLSFHAIFVRATRSGELEIDVESLVQARSIACVRIQVRQGGAVTTIVTAWLTSDELPPMEEPATFAEAAGPDRSEPISYRAESVSFKAAFEARAIDYPPDEEAFHGGLPVVDLWLRPNPHLALKGALVSQLFDILAFDSHLLESTRRARFSAEIETASLDLGISWSGVAPVDGWRRLRAESGPAGGRTAATHSVIVGNDGMVIARAQQQGRLRHPRIDPRKDES